MFYGENRFHFSGEIESVVEIFFDKIIVSSLSLICPNSGFCSVVTHLPFNDSFNFTYYLVNCGVLVLTGKC